MSNDAFICVFGKDHDPLKSLQVTRRGDDGPAATLYALSGGLRKIDKADTRLFNQILNSCKANGGHVLCEALY